MSPDVPAGPLRCPACGTETGPRDRFCPACGAAIAAADVSTCLACGTSNPVNARFCAACGSHLSAVGEAERRIITVLFADLTGFTSLTERLDPENVRRLVAGCLDPICRSVSDWGGYVDKFIGDCVMALFGAPVAYENEEERAIRAALDMQTALGRFRAVDDLLPSEQSLQLRIGINTGPVVTGVFSGGGARNYTAVGDVVNVASRLQGQCEPGEILVGSATYEQTRHVFEFGDERVLRVKGKSEPVRARTVLGLRVERGRLRGIEGFRAPLVGRTDELSELRARWADARAGRFRHALLLGPPGIGKTRLVEELALVEEIPEERIAVGNSFPYARSTPWEPIARLLRDLHEIDPDVGPLDAARAIGERCASEADDEDLAAALAVALGAPLDEVPTLRGFGAEEIGSRVADAVAQVLAAPGDAPRLLVLEDLHWADNATLDLLGALPDRMPDSPVFLLLVARIPLPGETRLAALLRRVGAWIEIAPLTREESFRLVYALLGEHGLPERFLDRTVGRAEGNPMFIEEMIKALKQRGAIVRTDDRWEPAGDLDRFEIPDSVESLLSTRIDGLASSTKRVLQYASIVGRRFWSGVLRDALVRQPVESEIDELLRGQIVLSQPDSVVEGDREYLFQNLLLQEVAYDGLLRGLRSELHGAVAAWMEAHLATQGPEADELIAFHYERSATPTSAVPFLERAARRARARGALGDAFSLAYRALGIAEPAQRKDLLLLTEDLAAAGGDRERWDETLAALGEEIGPDSDAGLRAELAFRRARRFLAGGQLSAARASAEEALAALGPAGHGGRRGDVHSLLGRIQHQWGNYPAAREQYRAALPLLRASGDALGELVLLDRLGLVEVDLDDFCRAVELFDDVLVRCREGGHRALEARVLAHRATALRWLGRYEDALADAEAALELSRRSGSRSLVATAEMTVGFVLAAAGQPGARDVLETAARKAADAGRPALEARAWMSLAELEDEGEAEAHADRARALASRAGLVHIDILARTRLADLALARGRTGAAERLSGSALRRLRRHGSIQGPEEVVLFTRARTLEAVGRAVEAAELLAEARELLHEKAARIGDPEERRRFLEDVHPNPEILAGTAGPSPRGARA
jgi:class 3 adenylate cyclase/tetratricopeptide (TPR) repeat protein